MRVQNSDARFEAHIRDNEADLVRYLQRRMANSADAAEAYGEVLLAAWRQRKKCPTDAARPWLFVVARNVLRNAHRTSARRSAATERFIASLPTPVATDPGHSVDVARALRTLGDDDAELVRLIYWDGFEIQEAAVIVGLNPSTARSRLASAKKRLREVLEPSPAHQP